MPEADVSVVPFDRAHLSGVLALFAAEGWSYADDAERAWRALTAQGSTCIVALVDGSVVGVAHVLSDGEIQAFLTVLLVEQAHRRVGIGARLVRDAFANAGVHRMDLMSCADGFYDALGFQRMSGFRITEGGEFRQTFR